MQTAINWLISVLAHNDILDHKALSSNERLYNLYKRLKEQAEAKEKQQIIDAANITKEDRWFDAKLYNNCGEKYFAETYGSKGSDEHRHEHRHSVYVEISDEEIILYAMNNTESVKMYECFLDAIKWYREQLKKK